MLPTKDMVRFFEWRRVLQSMSTTTTTTPALTSLGTIEQFVAMQAAPCTRLAHVVHQVSPILQVQPTPDMVPPADRRQIEIEVKAGSSVHHRARTTLANPPTEHPTDTADETDFQAHTQAILRYRVPEAPFVGVRFICSDRESFLDLPRQSLPMWHPVDVGTAWQPSRSRRPPPPPPPANRLFHDRYVRPGTHTMADILAVVQQRIYGRVQSHPDDMDQWVDSIRLWSRAFQVQVWRPIDSKSTPSGPPRPPRMEWVAWGLLGKDIPLHTPVMEHLTIQIHALPRLPSGRLLCERLALANYLAYTV